jgi:biotin carboxyl carrier protein
VEVKVKMILSNRTDFMNLGSAIILLVFSAPSALQAQDATPAPSQMPSPAISPSPLPKPATTLVQPPVAPQAMATTNSPAVTQMTSEIDKLAEDGKLSDQRAVASAVKKVINQNSVQHDIPAPLGAKVIAVHKHPGDMVKVGEIIVTLLVDGKKVPILAKQDGVMQAINVSKGGIIGNSRPRSAKNSDHSDQGMICITLRSI